METSFYKILVERTARAEHSLSECQAELAQVKDRNDILTVTRRQYEECITVRAQYLAHEYASLMF